MRSQFPQLFSYSPNGPNDHQLSPRTTIRSLPNEVLLEIFHSFRQTFQCELDYERAWNSNKGWFKLAHVCREWRQLVLTSPSRLHVRLLFTEHRSGRANAIRRLPPLPIVVDYRSGAWLAKTQIQMISALAYPDRVCRIAFDMGFKQSKHTSKLLEAMNQPFPSLESLELHRPGFLVSHSPPPFLTAQTTHLQSLKFVGNVTELSRVLPYTSSLVDLTFRFSRYSIIFSPHDTQLLVHLQGLSSLRRLKVESSNADMPDLRGGMGSVLLPSLTSLSFTGPMSLLEGLMAGLSAPSLQELRISILGTRAIPSPTHLTSFIRNLGRQFLSAQVSTPGDRINLVLSTDFHSTDDLPFKIVASGIHSILLMGDLFPETLATIEDVFLASPFDLGPLPSPPDLPFDLNRLSPFEDPIPSYRFFTSFHSAKILRVSPGIEQEIQDILNHEELPLDVLPSLEEIELNATMSSCTPIQVDENHVASVLELFKPFVAARQQAGQLVNVHWNTDRVLPEYFCDTDT